MLLLKRFTQLVKTFFNFRHLTYSQFSYPVMGQRKPAALTNSYPIIIVNNPNYAEVGSSVRIPRLLALRDCAA